jgi:hypothetical protein
MCRPLQWFLSFVLELPVLYFDGGNPIVVSLSCMELCGNLIYH